MGSNKLIRDKNSLAVVNPKVSQEWDYEKNSPLTPYDVAGCSDKKVWWICTEHAHSWRASVGSRNTNGNGCPYCAGQKVLKGFNDLASANKELAKEWDFERNGNLKPDMVTAGSNRKVYWIDSNGHSWMDTVSRRNHDGRGCPYCAGQKILAGFNDLATTYPFLADEWDREKNYPLTPQMVMAGTEKKVWWNGRCGHNWQAYIYARKAGAGCPYCAGQKVLKGFNDLATKYPEIAASWNYEKNNNEKPDMITSGTNKKYWWICHSGHEWEAPVSVRTRGGGCPYCNGKRVIEGENDLFHAAPYMAQEWDYEKNGDKTPVNTSFASKYKAWWRCSLGHGWQATVANRFYGTGCPYCSGKKVLKGFNDLATTYPDIAAEWHEDRNNGTSPDSISPSSKKYIWFKCNKGHEWHVRLASRTNGNTGCPYCAGTKAETGVNDIKTLYPELMEEWDRERNKRIESSNLLKGSRLKVWWKCKYGHSWKTSVSDRTKGTGCPYCNRKKNKHVVYSGYNDLKENNPEMAKEWDYQLNGDLGPEDVFPSSNREVWWKCSNGHSWRASPNQRSVGQGCPFCDGKTPQRRRLI